RHVGLRCPGCLHDAQRHDDANKKAYKRVVSHRIYSPSYSTAGEALASARAPAISAHSVADYSTARLSLFCPLQVSNSHAAPARRITLPLSGVKVNDFESVNYHVSVTFCSPRGWSGSTPR